MFQMLSCTASGYVYKYCLATLYFFFVARHTMSQQKIGRSQINAAQQYSNTVVYKKNSEICLCISKDEFG